MEIDQIKLNPELSSWLEARQRALKVTKTTRTPSGQTLDWVPIESQLPSGKIASPPLGASMPIHAEDKTRPVRAAGFELDDPKVQRGPAGTVPILRPDLSRLTRTIALKDYMQKRGGLRVNKARPSAQPGDPFPAGYFHQIDAQSGTFYGWDGFLNVWDPTINSPPGQGDDHSILQVWLQNYVPQIQSIEGGWTVDQNVNGDTQPHIFTFYTANGYGPNGNNQGGYNAQFSGWVQYSSSVFPGILLAPVSTWGGTQYEVSMKFQLYREPTNGQLNWWVAVQGIWMGYYPASLFPGGLASNAAYAGCGGEVDSTLANPELTTDEMGSGWQAQAGWTKAAYLRNLRVQSDLAGTMVNNNGSSTSDTATPGGADPYTIQMDMQSGTAWNSYFYVGGPTPLADATATFNQITFNITTGGDDLRHNSSATASVVFPNGTQTFTLKAQSDSGWGKNSNHVKTFTIAGPAQLLSAFGPITITLTSHNSWPETDDNWNIQTCEITASGTGGSAVVYNQGGNPLARLTGSGPSVTLQPVAGA